MAGTVTGPSVGQVTDPTLGPISVSVRVPVRVDFAGGWSDVHYYSSVHGGAVLNAAIGHYVHGEGSWGSGRVHVEYDMRLPSGSGLGTSAALDVAWLALTNELMNRRHSLIELAEGAYKVEKLLGIEGGKQDHYAAALGGFNLLEFGPEDQPARVTPIELPREAVRTLQDRCVLCFSGSSHNSDALHRLVWERYRAGDTDVAHALGKIARTAVPAAQALMNGNVSALAYFVTENREWARKLQDGLVTPRMDELFEIGEEAGAIGSKACGAGGGGCLLFICEEDAKADVEAALTEAGIRVMPLKFEPPAPQG